MDEIHPKHSLGPSRADMVWDRIALGEAVELPFPCTSIRPILVSIRQWDIPDSWRQRKQISRSLEETARALFLNRQPHGGCIWIEETHLLIIQTEPLPKDIEFHCSRYIQNCGDNLPCQLICCVGDPVPPSSLPAVTDQLLALENNCIVSQPILFLSGSNRTTDDPSAHISRWRHLLRIEDFSRLLEEMECYFVREQHTFTSECLQHFHQDFIQVLYGVMEEKQIPAHILFQRKEHTAYFRDAPDSIGSTITWLFSSVTALSVFLEETRRSQNYTQQACAYVMEHLNQDFTRQDIAEHVHLSQNHLARLFRKETGMSISEFILQERMKRAFQLLTGTQLAVGDIALKCGYENYSYFLTLFRRVSGMTPSQYRMKYSGDHITAKGE